LARLRPCNLPVTLITTNETLPPLISIWNYLSQHRVPVHHLAASHLDAMTSEHSDFLVNVILQAPPRPHEPSTS